jgi:tetratricopeptide (TPR) repeat protein
MKVPAQIAVPVLLAVAAAGAFVAFLWWQLAQSTALIQGQPEDEERDAPTIGQTVTPVDPRDQALLYLREGDLLALQGDWRGAEAQYQKAVEADGGLPALRKLAQAQLQRRDVSNLRSTLRRLRTAGARPEDLLLLESIVELRSGEFVRAQEILDSAEESPQKHYGLALLALVEGNHAGAQENLLIVQNGWEPVLRSYARTLQAAYDEFALFPDGSNMHLITLLARALAQVQECELALPLLVQVTIQQGDYRDAWIVQGYCELVTERPEEALTSLERAYNLDPQKPEIQYFLARAYAALDQHSNAITFFEYALQNGFTPESEVRRFIAAEALESGNLELALAQYEALSSGEDATLASYQGFVAASLAMGSKEEAFAKALRATEVFSSDAEAWMLLGRTARDTGDAAAAKAAFEHALTINPNLSEAKQELR